LPFPLAEALFLRPLYVADTGPTAVSVQVETVEGASRITIADPDGGEAYATAMAEPAPAQDRRITPPADWDERATGSEALPSAQDKVMNFGRRWRVLRAVKLAQGEGWAELRLPQSHAAEAAAHQMHPALLDIATGWAMKLIPGWGGSRLWVPVGYERLTLLRPLGPHLVSHVRLQPGTAEGSARFDVTLALPDGTVAAEIEGFTLRRMAAGLSAAPAAKPARGAESPGERRLRHNVSQGIPGALGPEVMRRAMGLGLPQVYVSSLDLPALVAEATIPAVGAPASEAAFERPDLDAEVVAPAAGTESELAAIWSDLLGVRQIGAGDSFFDLGGHSLVAVRMFGQVRKVFGVDFPISTLFEAPDVGRLAALIEARVGPRAGTPAAAGVDGAAAAAPAGPARRYVVDMGGRQGGTPFFIVAGMFGNVMNLHQMAQRVGQDRRFYGLQARGLFGEDRPHESFAEAAADYLAEIRQIQPRGPYLLGGFSGGGLIALEMARLLAAAGEETAMLVMLDTPLPMRPALSRRDRVLIRAQEMREQGLSFWSDWAKNKLAYELSKRRKERDAVHEEDEAEGFHDLAIEAAFRGALPKVALAEWPGPVTLFRPPLDYRYKVSDGQFVTAGREYLIPDNGWGRWMPRLEVLEVPGDHDSMVLEPNVRKLGGLMREILRRHDRGGDQRSAAE
ncbi:MAG: polyketide synthase dehydratase domain-containing protein, partial [Paracoccus sp. (in: a-proteobacteria)]